MIGQIAAAVAELMKLSNTLVSKLPITPKEKREKDRYEAEQKWNKFKEKYAKRKQ